MLRHVLNLNKGVLATYDESRVVVHQQGVQYGLVQDILGAYLRNGHNFQHVRSYPDVMSTLKAYGVFGDGDTCFIQVVEVEQPKPKHNHI